MTGVTRRGLLIGAVATVLISALVSWGVSAAVVATRKPLGTVATGSPDLSATPFAARYVFASPKGVSQGTALGYQFDSITQPVPAGPAIVGFSISITLQVASTVRCFIYDADSGTELATSSFQLAPVFQSTNFTATRTVDLTAPATIALRCEPGSGGFTALYVDESIVAVSFAS